MGKRTYDDFISNEFNATFFEEASKAWRLNKVEREDGTFQYKCTYIKRRGKRCTPCNRVVYEYELNAKKKPLLPNCDLLCKVHINKKPTEGLFNQSSTF